MPIEPIGRAIKTETMQGLVSYPWMEDLKAETKPLTEKERAILTEATVKSFSGDKEVWTPYIEELSRRAFIHETAFVAQASPSVVQTSASNPPHSLSSPAFPLPADAGVRLPSFSPSERIRTHFLSLLIRLGLRREIHTQVIRAERPSARLDINA